VDDVGCHGAKRHEWHPKSWYVDKGRVGAWQRSWMPEGDAIGPPSAPITRICTEGQGVGSGSSRAVGLTRVAQNSVWPAVGNDPTGFGTAGV